MTDDDDLPQQKKSPAVGDDLYDCSVAELKERIALFRGEIHRIEQIYAEKTAGLNEAEALFGKS
ncbi:MAG: hypothetical protein COA47_15415 [Robiginitomaculum sp.]|nr:MAG: hypothetical protein COA47_15415 [Robiginitomaculum sp.]